MLTASFVARSVTSKSRADKHPKERKQVGTTDSLLALEACQEECGKNQRWQRWEPDESAILGHEDL